jgi:hypothetical protein
LKEAAIITDNENECYIYEIDESDRIVRLGDNWCRFARENGAPELCDRSSVLDRPLWDFVSHREVHHIYSILLEKARTERRPIIVPIRCDAPDKRRFIEIDLTPLPMDHVEFKSRVVRMESRDALEILERSASRSDEFLRICSFCKKIALSDETWAATEEAVKCLKLFESPRVPQLTHGICPGCYEAFMASMKHKRPRP